MALALFRCMRQSAAGWVVLRCAATKVENGRERPRFAEDPQRGLLRRPVSMSRFVPKPATVCTLKPAA